VRFDFGSRKYFSEVGGFRVEDRGFTISLWRKFGAFTGSNHPVLIVVLQGTGTQTSGEILKCPDLAMGAK
jgi:hypothetical protein